jgi:SH3-like domain-containing protein
MIGVLPSFSDYNTAALSAQNRDQADMATGRSVAFVTVMSAPSEQSRSIAELRNGQLIKILKAKDNWLKITWQTDNTLSQGWLEKCFVNGKTIHAHR